MKLQNLTIIFIIIIMPIVLILSAYNQMQINTIKLQTYYDSKLTEAVYDAMKAYKINIRNNPYAIHQSSRKRDIEASNQVIISSLTTALGIGGYGEHYVKPYIPAVIYSLYNGFYIYAPEYNENTNKYEHMLKPYYTYSARYQKGTTDIVVNYSLDNYITIIGSVRGEYVNRSGYLISDNLEVTNERLSENILFNGVEEEYTYVYIGGEKRYYEATSNRWFSFRNGRKIYTGEQLEIEDENAMKYTESAREFTDWVRQNLSDITAQDINIVGKSYTELANEYSMYTGPNSTKPIFVFDSEYNDFEDESSIFDIHRKNVTRIMIQEQLRASITNYNLHSEALSVNYNFKVPILTEEEWDKITTNISITTFMQGLPVGFKTYNSYVTITSTENYDYSTKEDLCFINLDEENAQYHMIDCPKLTGTNITGYRKVDFGVSSTQITSQDMRYYYKHTNLPCYTCIVNRNYEKETLDEAKQIALNNALAREKNMLHY